MTTKCSFIHIAGHYRLHAISPSLLPFNFGDAPLETQTNILSFDLAYYLAKRFNQVMAKCQCSFVVIITICVCRKQWISGSHYLMMNMIKQCLISLTDILSFDLAYYLARRFNQVIRAIHDERNS